MSPLAIHPTIRAAIGTVLAFFAIAGALISATVYPTLLIAVATGLGIGVAVLGFTIALAALFRLRMPSSNDDWVFW